MPIATATVAGAIGGAMMWFFKAFGTELLHSALKALAVPIVQMAQSTGWLDPDTYSVVDQYCQNLTEQARQDIAMRVMETQQGKIVSKRKKSWPSIGRRKEEDVLIDILSRGGKGNPCIIGDAGVGKTALVEGLAYRIAQGDVPEDFKNKKIIKVNMVSLIAGKAYNRGDGAVGRIRALFDYAAKDPDVILFMDEYHQIVQCNAAELFKTFLDRGNIKMIAATTVKEYKKYIEPDLALKRRYSNVYVKEPNEFETYNILKGIKSNLLGDNVEISDELLMTTVKLTGRYMKNRTYPDKAIDVVSSAAILASRRNNNSTNPSKILTITEKDIMSVISSDTNIPLGDLSKYESKLLNSLEERLEGRIKGQSEAVKFVSEAIRRSRTGISDDSEPRASFLFAGTSGVGKTLLANETGKEFGNIIKVDLEQNYPVNSLMEKVWKNPYSVVVFDKLERADTRIIGILSSILENGYAFDASGNKVDFTNSIIIMTTNVGEKSILGFSDKEDRSVVKKMVIAELEKFFGNAFINHIDETVVFNKLNSNSFKEITKVCLDLLEHTMREEKINLKFDESVVNYISSLNINHATGAYQIKKVIRQQLERPIANMIVKGEIEKFDTVVCSVIDRKIQFNVIKEEK